MDEQNLNESKPSNCKTPLLKKALICSGCFVALTGLCFLAVYLVSENSHVIMVPWGRGLWVMCDPQPPVPKGPFAGLCLLYVLKRIIKFKSNIYVFSFTG